MSLLDFMRVYIFSEVDGVVLLDGQPVSNARVVRSAEYRNKLYTDTIKTDDQGRFHFDDIYRYSIRLAETVILQKIIIYYGDKEYLAWKQFKQNDHRYGELNVDLDSGLPMMKLQLGCELTVDQDSRQVIGSGLYRNTIHGLGRWD